MTEATVAVVEGEDADNEETTVDIASLPKFTISVLANVKATQLQNGLRHNNYLQYRRYCSNRLRTIRKRVGFTHRAGRSGAGKGKTKKGKPHKGGAHTFLQRGLEEDFTDPQYPFLALVNAERAWAYAMQLKQESESKENPRLKFHYLQRLRKAVFWSAQLKKLATVRGDERTSLECEAYHAWLAGNAAMESDRWESALEYFVATQTIYKQLVRVSSVVEQDLFNRRVMDVATQIEFIQYKIDLSHGKGSSAGLIAQMGASGLGLLQSKLEGVLKEEREKNSTTLSRVEWCRHNIPIDNQRVRLALLSARDMATQLKIIAESGPESDDFDSVYFDLMSRYDDAQQLVERDIANVSKVTMKADEVKLQMELLRSYIKSTKLEHTLRKNTSMIHAYAERWMQQQRRFGGVDVESAKHTGRQAVRATDVVKLHDTVLQNIADAKSLQGSSNDVEYQERFQFKHGVFTVARCFFVGEALLGRRRFADAYAVYNKGLSLRSDLAASASGSADQQDLDLLQRLDGDLEGGRCRCIAKTVLEGKETHGDNQSDPAFINLLDRRDEFRKVSARSTFPFSVASFPPAASAVAVKPLFFDLARDDIPVPRTSHLSSSSPRQTGSVDVAKSPAAATASYTDDEFESVDGSDDSEDSSDSSDVQQKEAVNGTKKSGGSLLGAAKKWFGR